MNVNLRSTDRCTTNEDEIIRFIGQFRGAENVFLYGCCYWFAYILKGRFGAEIYYDDIINHFVGKIGEKFYDVSGEVSGDFAPWEDIRKTDKAHYKVILRDCIRKAT